MWSLLLGSLDTCLSDKVSGRTCRSSQPITPKSRKVGPQCALPKDDTPWTTRGLVNHPRNTKLYTKTVEERLWDGCEFQTQGPELKSPFLVRETKELAVWMMYGNLKVAILQAYGGHPVIPSDRWEDLLGGLHAELGLDSVMVQHREDDDRAPRTRCFQNHKHPAVETWVWRRNPLHCSLP